MEYAGTVIRTEERLEIRSGEHDVVTNPTLPGVRVYSNLYQRAC